MIGYLEETASLLHAVVNTSPDAVIVIDQEGAMRLFSPAAEQLFGYAASEALGQNVKVLMPPHFREQHDEFIARYLASGERRIIGIGRVVAGQRKDGSSFPIELFIGETLHQGERLFVGFARDLSSLDREQRRAQQLQAKLFHASRVGEMGQMASGLAHEITQPLGAIMNYAQTARRIGSQPAAHPTFNAGEIFEKIEQQARRAVEIVRRLRSFVEKRERERTDCELHALIEEAVALAALGPEAHGVRVNLDLLPGAVIVAVDRIQIQQVLVNLIRNGIEATIGLGRRELRVSTVAGDAGAVRVSVSDTGRGVEPELAAQLFESFVTSKPEGLGVGLSISKAIIEDHGGEIWHTPNADVGASFHFTLPLPNPESSVGALPRGSAEGSC